MGAETSVYVRKKTTEISEMMDSEDKNDDSVWEDSNLGCLLFFQYKTPCLGLEALPWTYEHPMPLTENMVREVITFYDEKIAESQEKITQWRQRLDLIEQRFVRATPELYDMIRDDSDGCLDNINEIEKEIKDYRFQKSRFELVLGMMDLMNPEYELIYCKC